MAIALLQDFSFAFNDIFLLIFKNECFIDDLHGHEHAKPANKVHFGESSCSQAFDNLKIG